MIHVAEYNIPHGGDKTCHAAGNGKGVGSGARSVSAGGSPSGHPHSNLIQTVHKRGQEEYTRRLNTGFEVTSGSGKLRTRSI